VIFSFGRIHAQIRAADARADGAVATYEKAVLTALNDSETALNRYAATVAARTDRDRALADASVGTLLAQHRFRAGEDDRIQWLEAKSAMCAIEQAALASRTDALVAYFAVAKALGGGWPPGQPIEPAE
jgi:outer membrane protein TolC